MKIVRWMADFKPSQNDVEEMFKDEGLDGELETYQPQTAVVEHKHPFDEIRVVLKGALRFNVSGNEFLLREGDRLELASNTKHWSKVESEEPSESLVAYRIL